MARRQERMREIRELGHSGKPEDIEKLMRIIEGESPPTEQTTAIRALGTSRQDSPLPRLRQEHLVSRLKSVCSNSHVSIRTQAAILLYKWGEKEFALPTLEEAVKMGVPVRGAFFEGYENGRMKYAPEAEAFFMRLLESKHQHIRLDAGLALLRMGRSEPGIRPFVEGVAAEQPPDKRLMTVHYTAGIRDVPEILAILEQAVKDPDPKVSARARQLLDSAPNRAVRQ